MRYFSYNDYIDCNTNENIQKILTLEEKRIKYQITNSSNIVHLDANDFIQKKIILNDLKDIKTFINFLNTHFQLKDKYKVNDFQIYKNVFKKEYGQNFLLYNIKTKQIFFFITVISIFDSNIPYKVLLNSIKIIDYWKKRNINSKKVRYPIVVPIIIYIGKKPLPSKIPSKTKIKFTKFEKNKIDLFYNIVDLSH